jgi:O-antigen ligase
MLPSHSLSQFRLTTLITLAVFFLLTGTFTSVTIQGAYLVLFLPALIYYTYKALGRNFKLPASAWWLLAVAFTFALSILVNWNDIPRPFTNLARVKYYLYAALGIFPVGVWLKNVSDRTKRRLLIWFAIAFSIAALYVVINLFFVGSERRAMGSIMRYAYGTAYTLLLMLGMLLHHKKFQSWYDKKWAIAGLVMGIIGLIFINQRGAQGSFLLALPLVLWSFQRRLALIAFFILSLAGSFVAYNYFYGTENNSKIRILNAKSNESDSIRREQWLSAYYAFTERPFLGWGYGNFHTQNVRVKEERGMKSLDFEGHAHHVFLEVLAGTGIIGSLFFVGFLLTWVWECWSYGGMTRTLMMPVFLALLFQAQFESILDANNMAWLGFLYMLTICHDKRYQSPL